ncbi:diguanylate cyclase [Enterovibrio norvegicus]|uniref:GGDEF domain-containing protein n=1 Tax=Enterovibrio norvegicus TaxID=188144 RepID=UPI000C82ADCB|nr:GGDEF domain-containing protein [Enterovibrio norvegicus]MCC4799459.1 GGDEF domain-containing protein [Enterovibrio norvegicus]PMI34677.1 diguanylate cyclase [Enterovibrio norvegicus]PMI35686.1 diguanylate cyclase [Enterovibrio norvegicus]PMN54921.1 diguanylate cyclase [Enterovibrio norvegicus]TKF17658.1 GGDEF domain-containing protein [Enterovibrio norvegicus]
MENAQLSSHTRIVKKADSLEGWCEEVFDRLRQRNEAQNIALFIWHEEGLKLVASQTQREFCFFQQFRPAEEYSGYRIDWEKLAESVKENDGSYISELPINAAWRQSSMQWEHAVIPLYENEEILGYMLLEVELFNEEKKFSESSLLWLKDRAERQLKCRILSHNLNQFHLSSKKNELDLALNNHTLASQLSHLKSLHEISLRFTKATSISSLCRIAVELGKSRLQIDRMAIFLCDMETCMMWGTWGTDKYGNTIDRSDVNQDLPNNPFMEEALARKNELIVKENVPLYFGQEQVGIGWNIMMAMWNNDECIGWIAADNLIYKSPLDEPKKEAIKLLAASVCQKIIKLRETEEADERFYQLQEHCRRQTQDLEYLQSRVDVVNAQNQWLGIHDASTGLLGARYFDLSFASFVACARDRRRNIASFSICMDFYKAFQKAYGEEATIRVFQTIAREVKSIIKPVGLNMLFTTQPGKLSLLVHCNDEVLLKEVADKIVKTAYTLNIENKASPFYQRVTLSVGLSTNCVSLFSLQSKVLKKAEKACLMAEKLGKNRYCVD